MGGISAGGCDTSRPVSRRSGFLGGRLLLEHASCQPIAKALETRRIPTYPGKNASFVVIFPDKAAVLTDISMYSRRIAASSAAHFGRQRQQSWQSDPAVGATKVGSRPNPDRRAPTLPTNPDTPRTSPPSFRGFGTIAAPVAAVSDATAHGTDLRTYPVARRRPSRPT